MSYENLDVATARKQVEQEGYKPRIIDLDNPVNVVATADIREDRINLLVKGGKVVGTSRG